VSGNVGEFDSCQGIVGEKSYQEKLSVVNFAFGATLMFSSTVLAS